MHPTEHLLFYRERLTSWYHHFFITQIIYNARHNSKGSKNPGILIEIYLENEIQCKFLVVLSVCIMCNEKL